MGAKCAHCEKENEGWVPLSRLNEVLAEKASAEQLATQLQGQLEPLQAELNEWQGKGARWELERSALRAGITHADGVEVALWAWERVPADKRPQGGFEAWLQARDALPTHVATYLPSATAAPTGQQPAAPATSAPAGDAQAPLGGAAGDGQAQGQRPPPSTSGMDPRGAAPSPGGFTAEQLASMSPEEYRRHRETILEQHRQQQRSQGR